MRARTWTGAMMIAAAVALVAAAVVTSAGAREDVREIHLVARGMAFYLDADPATANPTLAVKPGERVRFVQQLTELQCSTPVAQRLGHDGRVAATSEVHAPRLTGPLAEPRGAGPQLT